MWQLVSAVDYFRICASNIWRASNIGNFSADIQITVELGIRRKPIHVTAVSWVESSVLQTSLRIC